MASKLLFESPAAQRSQPLPASKIVEDLVSSLPSSLPKTGLGGEKALRALAPCVLEGSARLDHPGYFAHMDPPAADEALAASVWQVSANNNTLHPDGAPAGRLLEERLVSWLAPSFGMAGGHVTTGSTVANLTALWAARDVRGVRRVVASERSHNSIEKACRILGMEFVKAEACAATHSLRRGALEEALGEDAGERARTAVVLTAGTVATGAVDELLSSDELGVAWVHCDAAWAGPLKLASSASKLRLFEVLSGLEVAESCSFSAHKWLYQPKVRKAATSVLDDYVRRRTARGAKRRPTTSRTPLSSRRVRHIGGA